MQNKNLILILTTFIFFVGHRTSFADDTKECMPGWNATLKKARAVERAYGCSKSGSLENCKIEMGVGVFAAVAAASDEGKALGSKIADKIRDPDFRPCPIASNNFSIWMDSAFAGGKCIPHPLMVKEELRRAVTLAGRESAIELKNQQSILDEKKKLLETKNLTPEQVKSNYKINVDATKQALKNAENVANTNYNDYIKKYFYRVNSNLSNAYRTNANIWNSLKNELNKVLPEIRGSDEISVINIDQIKSKMDARYIPHWKQNTIISLSSSAAQSYDEVEAAKAAEAAMLNDPKLLELKENWNRAKAAASSFEAPPMPATSMPQETAALKKEVSILEQQVKLLEDRDKAVRMLLRTTDSPMSVTDLKAAAKALGSLMPERTLLATGNSSLLKVILNLKVSAAEVASKAGASLIDSPGMKFFLMTYGPRLAPIGQGLLKIASLGAGAAMVLGSVGVQAATFTPPAGDEKCGDMTQSKIYVRSPDKNCNIDLTMNNPVNLAVLEQDSESMCFLAKENPEVKSMIDQNYQNYFPQTKIQCSKPMTLTMQNYGSATYSQDEIVFTPPNGRQSYVHFDQNGNETNVEIPKDIRGGKFVKTDWGAKPDSENSKYSSFMNEYSNRLMPLIAEGSTCCSGQGMLPDDCAMYGINASNSGTKSVQPSATSVK